MATLYVLSSRGDKRVNWAPGDVEAGDPEALAAIAEAEAIFAREQSRGSSATIALNVTAASTSPTGAGAANPSALQVSTTTLLTVTEQGFGKRTAIDEYRVQSRGGVGIINIATTSRNGLVVGVAYVQEGDELLVITQQGMILRMQTNDVRSIGRATQGVTLINIEGEDKVVSIARLVEKEEEDTAPDAPEDTTN